MPPTVEFQEWEAHPFCPGTSQITVHSRLQTSTLLSTDTPLTRPIQSEATGLWTQQHKEPRTQWWGSSLGNCEELRW